MTRIDVHVDELLDRARSGELTSSERARLSAHCAACVTCRMELRWIGDDLHDALPSAADRAAGARAVEALLGSARERTSGAVPRRNGPNWWQATGLAFAGLLLASAAAALFTQVQAWRARETAAPTRSASPASTPAPVATPKHARRPRTQVMEPAPLAAPEERPVPQDNAVRADEPRSTPSPAPSPVPVPVVPRARRADALFARANAERAAGHDASALAIYMRLARAFPETRSAQVSHISQADLLLRDMGRPEEALTLYHEYLEARPRGVLVEEAYVGVAVSSQRLGREHEERMAWQALLDHHPDSPHAARARERLLTLSR